VKVDQLERSQAGILLVDWCVVPGSKHLIQCHCILPQFRNMNNPLFHKFVVYSKVDPEGDVMPRLVSCNNCGVTHKIIDFCKSEIVHGVEDSTATLSIDDIKSYLPDKIINVLEAHTCDIATWEQVADVFEDNAWGSIINISSQQVGDSTQIKTLTIRGSSAFKIDAHIRQDDLGEM